MVMQDNTTNLDARFAYACIDCQRERDSMGASTLVFSGLDGLQIQIRQNKFGL
jgi:hypothetical protein